MLFYALGEVNDKAGVIISQESWYGGQISVYILNCYLVIKYACVPR